MDEDQGSVPKQGSVGNGEAEADVSIFGAWHVRNQDGDVKPFMSRAPQRQRTMFVSPQQFKALVDSGLLLPNGNFNPHFKP